VGKYSRNTASCFTLEDDIDAAARCQGWRAALSASGDIAGVAAWRSGRRGSRGVRGVGMICAPTGLLVGQSRVPGAGPLGADWSGKASRRVAKSRPALEGWESR